jgi:hypothetical protein
MLHLEINNQYEIKAYDAQLHPPGSACIGGSLRPEDQQQSPAG